jgi:hypothetical protein
MEVRVHEYTGTDLSMNPAEYVAGGKTMIPLTIDRAAGTVTSPAAGPSRRQPMPSPFGSVEPAATGAPQQ